MATLILEDGTRFEGTLFGHKGNAAGEVVFTTGMAGYQETLTDPACAGQIVCMTYPLIGNVGVNDLDFESEGVHCAGLIISELCELPSNWQIKKTLQEYLSEQGVTGLCDVDTRALTRHLRTVGTMRGRIVADEGAEDCVKPAAHTCGEAYEMNAEGGELTFAVLDLGVKKSVLSALCDRGVNLKVYPADTSAKEMLEAGCDACFITSGPGKPGDYAAQVETVRALMEAKPCMGIALGHQLMALAAGGAVKPLTYGHHGSNLPVKDLEHSTCYVTAQHVGYTIDPEKLPEGAKITHINSNDQTIEGLRYEGGKSLSVQFYPDAGRGLYKSVDLYDEFIAAVRGAMAK